jgi:cell wall-associated NlpC family hydrolase
MKNKIMYILIFILYFSFVGCSTKSKVSINNKQFPNKPIYLSNEEINLYEALNAQYKEWKGTKYKYGGNSKNGVDCSAFVQRTFKDKLNIKIPRTTALQSKRGIEVSKEDLEMGDLVFFKTGYKSRHVGIYLNGGKFIHASTKRGVTISRLDNVYYSKHLWKIKRVIY